MEDDKIYCPMYESYQLVRACIPNIATDKFPYLATIHFYGEGDNFWNPQGVKNYFTTGINFIAFATV